MMKMTSSGQRGSSISFNKTQNTSSNQDHSNLVVTQQRARSSNAKASKSTTASSPWTPERQMLVKSTSQVQKKTIFQGIGSMSQRRVFDASPEPVLHHQHSDRDRTHGYSHTKINSSSLSAKPTASRQQSGTATHTSSTMKPSSSSNANRSASASYIQTQQAPAASTSSDVEKQYIEKIKQLKAENKKLVSLLRDSEKLFYQKLKETKKESENLSALFKQLWPLIKHKVKDPNSLLKTVNGLQGESAAEAPSAQIDELKKEIATLKENNEKLADEVRLERDGRQQLETQWRRTVAKVQEMKAFQQTVQQYTHTTASPLSPKSSHHQQLNIPKKSANNTASTSDSVSELVPSFLKALYITKSDTIFDDDEVSPTASLGALAVKSLTNSTEACLSAPEALKLKLNEFNRAKSAAGTHANSSHQPKNMQLKTSRESRPGSSSFLQTSEPKPPRDRSGPPMHYQQLQPQVNNFARLPSSQTMSIPSHLLHKK